MGNVLAPDDDSVFPAWVGATWERAEVLRYGENPHQSAALYRGLQPGARARRAAARQGDVATTTTSTPTPPGGPRTTTTDPCVAIIKHANPCGIAVGTDIASAHRKAHACDPLSAFGGVIAANREVDLTMAEQIADVFTEVVVAPSFTDDAVAVLTGKKNIRLLRLPHLPGPGAEMRPGRAAACCCRSRTGSTPRATTPRPGRWPPASRWTPPASTTSCSPGARCGR